MKPWYRSKMIWTSVITLLIGILGVFAGSEVIPTEYALMITGLLVPLLNVGLRWLTDQPITSFVRSWDRALGRDETYS